ncbi:unnamed protein product [Rhodiola kirilowii]
MDAKKSSSGLWEGCNSPKGSKWLADNLEAVDENVKLMLKLIEEDGDTFAKKAEMYYQKRPQLISCVDELHGQYCLLAERYYRLFKELHQNASPGLQAQNMSNDFDQMSQFYTPAAKLGAYQTGHQGAHSDMNLTSPDSNSDLSPETGSGSLSASLSDTDSDLFNSVSDICLSLRLQHNNIEMGSEYASMEEKRKLGEVQAVPCSFLHADEEGNYDDMLGRIKEYEEELRVLNIKLKLSEEEIGKHKMKLEDNEVLIADLQSRLQVAHMDIEDQKCKIAEEEGKVSELQDKLSCYKNDVSRSYEGTIGDLKAALCHVQEHLFVSVAQLESDIGNLLDQKNQLEAELVESKLRNTSLDNELQECKDQMVKIEASYGAQETSRQQEFKWLKAEQLARDEVVLQLNKSIDELKCKHHMLEAEKDDTTALLLTLSAELNSKNSKVRQLEDLMMHSCIEKEDISAKLKNLTVEAMSRSAEANELINDLSSQLVQKEEELDAMRAQIMEGAENKREAIRQLCFSLDHYKSGYKELCQAFVFPNRRPVSAS